jgi:hypothetical protein
MRRVSEFGLNVERSQSVPEITYIEGEARLISSRFEKESGDGEGRIL